jgi:hypothetical protein
MPLYCCCLCGGRVWRRSIGGWRCARCRPETPIAPDPAWPPLRPRVGPVLNMLGEGTIAETRAAFLDMLRVG